MRPPTGVNATRGGRRFVCSTGLLLRMRKLGPRGSEDQDPPRLQSPSASFRSPLPLLPQRQHPEVDGVGARCRLAGAGSRSAGRGAGGAGEASRAPTPLPGPRPARAPQAVPAAHLPGGQGARGADRGHRRGGRAACPRRTPAVAQVQPPEPEPGAVPRSHGRGGRGGARRGRGRRRGRAGLGLPTRAVGPRLWPPAECAPTPPPHLRLGQVRAPGALTAYTAHVWVPSLRSPQGLRARSGLAQQRRCGARKFS